MGFEADTLAKMTKYAHCTRLMEKDLIKKLLTSNRKIRLLVNNFLTRSLKVATDRHVAFIFPGYLLQNPCLSDQY